VICDEMCEQSDDAKRVREVAKSERNKSMSQNRTLIPPHIQNKGNFLILKEVKQEEPSNYGNQRNDALSFVTRPDIRPSINDATTPTYLMPFVIVVLRCRLVEKVRGRRQASGLTP
jgi:hypothetical protein